MMKITKLEYQKKDRNRVNVFIDDKFVTAVGANDILKLDLYNGKEISSEDQVKLIEASDFGKLFNSVLNFLSFRPRSEWEVRFKFRHEDEETLVKVVDKLKSINQINDFEFAKWFVDQRVTFKPEGKKALRFELSKKGIDKKIIDEVLVEQNTSENELARLAASKKKFKSRDQAIRFLASRGFSWDTINDTIKQVLPK